jgi:hypothetical protein
MGQLTLDFLLLHREAAFRHFEVYVLGVNVMRSRQEFGSEE